MINDTMVWCYFVVYILYFIKLTLLTIYGVETISALLAFGGESTLTGGFPRKEPVMPNFDVFFGVLLNGLLNKQLMCL